MAGAFGVLGGAGVPVGTGAVVGAHAGGAGGQEQGDHRGEEDTGEVLFHGVGCLLLIKYHNIL